MLDHARQFLALALPPPGPGKFINIHWKNPGKDGKLYWSGRPCETIDEAIRNIAWVLSFGNADIYVCMSTQTKFAEKISTRTGKPYRAAIRLQENIAALKSLYIDVDVKDDPKKGYASTEEAMGAVTAFLASAGLPQPSTAVASGSGGFHLHWVLTSPITLPIWQPLAQALVNATVAHQLKCDTQCTIDSARILRVPETFNQKHTPPKPTSLMFAGQPVTLEVMQEALAPYMGPPAQKQNEPKIPFDTPSPISGTNPELNAELGTNLEPMKIAVDTVVEVCPFIRNTLATGGVDRNEPQWFAAATVANFLEDGLAMFHAMSDQHPDYAPEATNEKYEQAAGKQGFKNIGWPSCQKISNSGAPECLTCPLLARGRSPLHFATGTADPVVGIKSKAIELHLPERYSVNNEGFIFFHATDPDGQELLLKVMDYPIFSGTVSHGPLVLRFVTSTSNGGRHAVELGGDVVNVGKDQLLKLLGAEGIIVLPSQAKNLQGFLMAWLKKLQSVKDATISQVAFGWMMEGRKYEGFAYAERVWTPNGDREAAKADSELARVYHPTGELQVWKDAAKSITDQKRPALEVILASAFAGPLVALTGFPGLVVSAYSPKSGIGKTTTMEVAQAVWGNPLKALNGSNDTPLSVINKVGMLSSITLFFDEIKSEKQEKDYCSTIFTLTSGKEKSRLTVDSKQRSTGTWSTMMISASNASLMDPMGREAGSTNAGFYRMFEFEVPAPVGEWEVGVGKMRRLSSLLRQNYGEAGLIYAKWLGANAKRIESDLEKLDTKLPQKVTLENSERMWMATIEVLILGAMYANMLKLTEFDIDGLKAFLMDTFYQNRKQVAGIATDISTGNNAVQVLGLFLNAMRARHTLVTNRILITPGKPKLNAIQVVQDASRLEEIVVQRGREDGLVRIAETPLSKWLRSEGHSPATWTKTMKEEYGARTHSTILGGGTEYRTQILRTIEIDLNRLPTDDMESFELPEEVTTADPSVLSANLDLSSMPSP